MVKVLDQTRVSPPPSSVPDTILPLTFFDVIFSEVPHVQLLLFYSLPHPTTHFLQTLLPNFKHSLSLSLQLFHPLAGHLTRSPKTNDYEIRYIDGDSVPLTIAESDSAFHQLTANHARVATQFDPLIPPLPTSNPEKMPLLSLQVTIFPNSGLCIGISMNHAVTEGRSLTHFLKSWASIFKSRGDLSLITSLPVIDRTLVPTLKHKEQNFFIEIAKLNTNTIMEQIKVKLSQSADAVQSTLILTRSDLDKLRKWVGSRVELSLDRVELSQKSSYYSSFVLTCAYMWVCLVKVRKVAGHKRVYFSFIADCRARLDPPLPAEYFGNCTRGCFAESNSDELSGENGLVVGCEVIKRAIREMEEDVLNGAELWKPRFMSLLGELVLHVAFSHRFGIYETDFGWGKPKKVEMIPIDKTGIMAIVESKDEEGGIEIGFALPKGEMLQFTSVFEEGLKVLT
ncbi:malonyl-coenzyme A:anthocyanin 3-O-glucoside-6''-O-malonyltransferase-like [Tasmannia lanceolata]|uniref:malonyl-coenzyme A:anthocyanin 3-O-glucoside-6''-O-malonyltransferase-like n=1 Tax=Tasmannia lanceolata TaxID=3420 RepID=UPI004062A056